MRILVLVAVLGWQSTAMAQAFSCNEAGNQQELNACALQESERADAELNRVYRQVRKVMRKKASFLKNLKLAQRAWIRFRDAELKARFTCEGEDHQMCWGSMYNMSYHYALAALTRARTKTLRDYLNGKNIGHGFAD
jgi:uncharacterized protein YecT (DUF1311 family)